MDDPGSPLGEVSLYAYPWDFVPQDPAGLTGVAAAAGVDRLVVATAYHSAELIAPRSPRPSHCTVEANVSHLPLPLCSFSGVRLPTGSLAKDQPDLFLRIADAAGREGLALSAWVVVLHNSDLAAREPELAVTNCFGDSLGHGLCPANPSVRVYAQELVGAVARTGHFDELFVESVAALPLGHGHPHELWSVSMDPLSRLLASLCFCAACRDAGQRAGIDVLGVRARVTDVLRRRWNSPLAGVRAQSDGLEMVTHMLGDADLAAYLRSRSEQVTSLAGDLAAEATAAGTRLAVAGPVFARPLAHAWLEGLDVAALAERACRLTLMPYYTDLAEVARDLDLARSLAPQARFQVLQTLWPNHHGGRVEQLLAKLAVARSLGIVDVGLYSWSTATDHTLSWIAEVARLVHGASG